MKASLFVDKKIPHLICQKLAVDSCSLEKISDPGSSKSRVYLYRADNKLVAAKITPLGKPGYRNPRIEPINHLSIRPLLGDKTAKIYWHGIVGSYYVMLYECVGVNSLHNEIQLSREDTLDLVDVWNESVSKLATIWKQTRKKVNADTKFARSYPDRYKRIAGGLKSYSISTGETTSLGSYLDYTVSINGRDYQPLASTLKVLEFQDVPDFTVTCHGDPQPSNIIVGADKTSWQFIDWEWSQTGHDWRMMAAHMYGWWLTREVSFKQKPTVSLDHNSKTIHIKYSVEDSRKRELFMNSTLSTLKKTAGLKEGTQDYVAFQKYLALLALGELRFLHIWRTSSNFPYLIGLGTQLVYDIEKSTSNE